MILQLDVVPYEISTYPVAVRGWHNPSNRLPCPTIPKLTHVTTAPTYLTFPHPPYTQSYTPVAPFSDHPWSSTATLPPPGALAFAVPDAASTLAAKVGRTLS